MPRPALAAVVLIGSHAATLAFVGPTPTGSLLSNVATLLASALAAGSCLAAAARAAPFGRTVWRLAAVSLGVWTLGQVTWVHTENVLHVDVGEPSWTHFLFRLSGAPLVTALLLDEEETPVAEPDWARILDFVQVGIVFLLFYFDLYFVAPGPGVSLASLQIAGFLDVSDVENWFLAVAFLLRASLARTAEARLVFGRVSLYLAVYAAASTTYNYGVYAAAAPSGGWFDLPWTVSLGVGAILFASWRPPAAVLAGRPEGSSGLRVFSVNWVSALAPLAVLALALQIARSEPTVAFVAAFASVAVFGGRLLVERYRQVRAVQALRASEERYSRLVELSPAAIAVFSDGRVTFANAAAARLVGAAAPAQLLGRAVEDFAAPHTLDATRRAFARSLEDSSLVEIEGRRLDGSPVHFEAVFIPIPSPEAPAGEAASAPGRLLVARDVTERRKAEAEREALIRELEARNAELERFTYTVSHDLKSPLITMRGFLGFVERAAAQGDAAAVHADMARIRHASDRMERLLNELLELSRVGRVTNPPEPVSIETLAREAVALAEPRLAERGVEVRIEPGLPVVSGDRIRLLEVVQNLVDNAAKFMGDQKHPTITIGPRAGAPDGQAIVFVCDNGIGIEPRFHDKVFGLFQKLDAGSQGTGVGLALVKRIVEVHGGRVWVESEGRGCGSVFCFSLPRVPPEGPAAASVP